VSSCLEVKCACRTAFVRAELLVCSCLRCASAGKVTKPVVAWVSGTCAKLFKSEVQFGHAGARSTGESDSAQVSRGSEPCGGSGAVP
jgi:hypothetical protein